MRKLKASIFPNQVENAICSCLERKGGSGYFSDLRVFLKERFVVSKDQQIHDAASSLVDQGRVRHEKSEGGSDRYVVLEIS